MIRQKKQLEAALNYIQQFAEQVSDVKKSIKREDFEDEINISFLNNVESSCNKIVENIFNQIDIIEKSGVYLEDYKDRYGEEKIREVKRRV